MWFIYLSIAILNFFSFVGKTSLMLRYIHDQFNDKHLSTIQAAFMKKKLKIGNNSIELAIWVIENDIEKVDSRNKKWNLHIIDILIKDTAGQERYHALSPIYYRGSNGAFLVYDITDTESFQRVSSIKQS